MQHYLYPRSSKDIYIRRNTGEMHEGGAHQWFDARTGLSFWAMWYKALIAFILNRGGFRSASRTEPERQELIKGIKQRETIKIQATYNTELREQEETYKKGRERRELCHQSGLNTKPQILLCKRHLRHNNVLCATPLPLMSIITDTPSTCW